MLKNVCHGFVFVYFSSMLAGQDYGLELPDTRIEPAKGSEHYARVMKALALFGFDETNGEQA